jgi:hypothetical protein
MDSPPLVNQIIYRQRGGFLRAISQGHDPVWCRDCRHQVEPDPAEQAERYGAATTVIEWHQRLSCSKCGSRQIDMVVTGTDRR